MNLFSLDDLRFRFGPAQVLRGITLELQPGEMTAVVGPNGAGKSTLMSILSGYRDGYEGSCKFLDVELREWKKSSLGRRMAFIPQLVRLEFPFTAEQVVMMGRTPHCHGLFESEQDRDAVRSAMEITDTVEFAPREFGRLSGGERQRVILASALAQQPEVLLLDEPTTFLDLKHQLGAYGLLRGLARSGMSVIAITHDLNLAAHLRRPRHRNRGRAHRRQRPARASAHRRNVGRSLRSRGQYRSRADGQALGFLRQCGAGGVPGPRGRHGWASPRRRPLGKKWGLYRALSE